MYQDMLCFVARNHMKKILSELRILTDSDHAR